MDESATAGHAPPELKTKLDQLDVTLHDLERVRQRLEDTEQRFSRITCDCGSLLWTPREARPSARRFGCGAERQADGSGGRLQSARRAVLQRVHAARRGKIRPVKDYLAR